MINIGGSHKTKGRKPLIGKEMYVIVIYVFISCISKKEKKLLKKLLSGFEFE